MAKVTIHEAKPIKPPSPTVNLELSVDEAKYLLKLVGNIGGDGKSNSLAYLANNESFKFGFRSINDGIYGALYTSRIRYL